MCAAMRRLLVGLCILAFACGHKAASAPEQTRAVERRTFPIPDDLKAKVELSSRLGAALYLQDKAAAIATDVMFENLPKIGMRSAGIAGYLALQDGTEDGKPLPSYTVYFFTADSPPLVKYRVHVPVSRDLKPTFDRVAPPEPATNSMKSLIAARAAAIEAAAPFVQPVNPAILPGDDFGEPGDVLVELIAGTNKRDTVVLGKHVRVVVGSDGAVRSVKALSNRVLELPTREGEKRPKALFVSEVVDDYPLEIHVFASMSSHLPLYVTNARGLWFVDGDQITFLGKQQ
jgi:hypothetical protein